MNILAVMGFIGCFLGLAIGLAGTYLAVVGAHGPRERAFMVKAAVGCWGLVGAYPAIIWLVPDRWALVWMAQALALPAGVFLWSRRQQQIRRCERRDGRRSQVRLESGSTVE